MKRQALALVGVAALAISLVGCSSGGGSGNAGATGSAGASGSAGGTPSVLIWADTPRIPQATEYQKEMKGKVDVKIETIAQADAQTKIALANRAKKGWPDIIFGTAADTAAFRDPSNGYAADLTNLVPKKIFDGFGEGNSDCKFPDGKYYCLKNDLANTVLWYDTKIFSKLGLTVPTTMQQFVDTALKLKGTGYSAGAYGDQLYYAAFLQSSECPLADLTAPNTVRIAPDDPKCTRVAKTIQPLMDAGVIDKRSPFDAGFIKNVAAQHKVAMTIGPSWWGDFVIKPAASWNVPAGEIADANMPTWGTGSDDKSGAYGGGVFTVSAHAKYPQAAADAAVWMTTSDWMATAATTPTFPAYGPANKLWAARISKDPYYAKDVYPAMAAGANKISQVDRPVRFPFNAQFGPTLVADINNGKSLTTALEQLRQVDSEPRTSERLQSRNPVVPLWTVPGNLTGLPGTVTFERRKRDVALTSKQAKSGRGQPHVRPVPGAPGLIRSLADHPGGPGVVGTDGPERRGRPQELRRRGGGQPFRSGAEERRDLPGDVCAGNAHRGLPHVAPARYGAGKVEPAAASGLHRAGRR